MNYQSMYVHTYVELFLVLIVFLKILESPNYGKNFLASVNFDISRDNYDLELLIGKFESHKKYLNKIRQIRIYKFMEHETKVFFQ